MELQTNDIIYPLLIQIQIECDELKKFIETRDYPFYKSSYYGIVVRHASAMLLLAGEIKAIHGFQDHTITIDPLYGSVDEIKERLIDCK